MNREYYIKSPCKINLHLEIHHKRTDGFHDLTSIFQLISLADEIFVKKNKTGDIHIDGDFNCDIEDNLIFKAAYEFLKIGKIKDGLDFRVKKLVPSGGGIGGGSSNCAATLRLLDFIYPNILSKKQLDIIALNLGSDVPFFMGEATALVQGRGERVKGIKTNKNYTLLIVNPSIHISTADAFSKLSKTDHLSEENVLETNRILDLYEKGPSNFNEFKNSFEKALQSEYTFINIIKDTMLCNGALHAGLSGSGSTMFGVFKDESSAIKARDQLAAYEAYKLYIVSPLEDYPKVQVKIF